MALKTIHYSNYKYLIDMEAFYPIRSNYLGFGMMSGLAIIYFLHNKKYILFLISIMAAAGIGARAPLLLSLIVSSPLIFKQLTQMRLKIKSKYFYILPMIVGVVVLYSDQIYYILKSGLLRFGLFFNATGDSSSSTRIGNYYYSLEHIFSTPLRFLFGEGIGSYGIVKNGVDKIDYPHNILLEVWFELGIVGLFLFSTSFAFVLLKRSNLLLKLIFIFFLLNAMKSQQLSGLRMLYGIMGLVLLSDSKKQL